LTKPRKVDGGGSDVLKGCKTFSRKAKVGYAGEGGSKKRVAVQGTGGVNDEEKERSPEKGKRGSPTKRTRSNIIIRSRKAATGSATVQTNCRSKKFYAMKEKETQVINQSPQNQH